MNQLDELSLQIRELEAKDLEAARLRATHPNSQAIAIGFQKAVHITLSPRLMSYMAVSETPDSQQTLVDESHRLGPLEKANARLQVDGIPKVYIYHGDLFMHIVTNANAVAETASMRGTGIQESVQDIQVALCPDSNGITKGKYSNHFRQVVSAESAPKVPELKISLTESTNGSADVSATVNDNAEIARYDFGNMLQGSDWTALAENSSRGQVRAGYILDRAGVSVSGNGAFLLEIPSLTGRFKITADRDVAAEVMKRNPSVHLLLNLNNAFESVKEAFAIAHEYWTNGNCVEILADQAGITTLKPGQSAPFAATVRHKVDGAAPTLPVSASAAVGTVAPSNTPIKSPANFIYIAPSTTTKDGRYRASLMTVSRRGKATLEVIWMGPITRWKIDGTYIADKNPHFECTGCASHVEMTFSAIVVLGYLSIPSIDPSDPTRVYQSPIFEGDGEAHINTTSIWTEGNCTVSDSAAAAIHFNATPMDESGSITLAGTNLVVSYYPTSKLSLHLCGGAPEHDHGIFVGTCYVSSAEVTIPAHDGGTWVRQGPDDQINFFSPGEKNGLRALGCETKGNVNGPSMTHSWKIVLSVPPA